MSAALERLVDRYAAWVGDRYASVERPDEIGSAEVDGWRLSLRRFGDGEPVVLCHGFGGNHASFELDGGRGLAPWLAARGFAAYVVTLRGTRGSEPCAAPDKRFRLLDWASRDVPALVAAVLARTGATSLAWVGHSLGALLPILAAEERIGRLVALGPPLDLPRTRAAGSLRLARWLCNTLTGGRALPMQRLARLEAPLMGRFALPHALSFVSPPNLEGEVARALHAHATEDLPGGVLDDLDDWCAGAGGWDERVTSALTAWAAPTACIVGDDDPWAPPDVVAARARDMQRATIERAVARRGTGFGHVELLAGPEAPSRTFVMVEDALRRM